MTNCKNCIFSNVYDLVNNTIVYSCSLLTIVRQCPCLVDINIANGLRDSFICPFYCSKENTVNVFVKVHKRQFSKADIDSLVRKVYGGDTTDGK